jgi:hypothetical protein
MRRLYKVWYLDMRMLWIREAFTSLDEANAYAMNKIDSGLAEHVYIS